MPAKSTPNRRERDARIEAFGQRSESLRHAAPVTTTPAAAAPKSKAYPFRMTDQQHQQLKAVAAAHERSMQWIFERVMFPEVARQAQELEQRNDTQLPGQTNIDDLG